MRLNNDNKLTILDATLRDGSYSVEYQFNADDTRLIAKVLDEAGFEMIEIGPGVGLNAQVSSVYKPAASDIEYIKAARPVVKHGKLGAFFVVGVGRKDDIVMAAQNGLDFLRIGINVDQYKDLFPYLKVSKGAGMMTCANMMKSYAVSADEFAKIAVECYESGADVVYLVDSAGGMLPEQVGEYICRCKELNPNIVLGFHGHDNLGMAIANTLAAIDNGATYIDSTVRGLGRSSGNTISEKLILVLKRRGLEMPHNVDMLLRLSDEVIKPYIQPESAKDIIYGYSQFHSSFLGIVKKYADKYNADINALIVAYTKYDKLGINERKLNEIASQLKDSAKVVTIDKMEKSVKKSERPEEQITLLKREFLEQKMKYGKTVFFNITKTTDSAPTSVSPILHSQDSYCFGSSEVRKNREAERIITKLQDSVDAFLIDSDIEFQTKEKNANLFFYKDIQLLGSILEEYVNTIALSKNGICKVFIDVDASVARYINCCENVELVDSPTDANVIVAGAKSYTKEELEDYKHVEWFVATKNGLVNITSNDERINFIRIDMTSQVVLEFIKKVNYKDIIFNRFGQRTIEDKDYCSGGFIAPKGTIVVDDVNNIHYKYGVSKGDGSINYFEI